MIKRYELLQRASKGGGREEGSYFGSPSLGVAVQQTAKSSRDQWYMAELVYVVTPT